MHSPSQLILPKFTLVPPPGCLELMITLVWGPGVLVPGPSGVDPSGPEEPVPDPSGVDPPGADDPAAGPPDPSCAGLSSVEFPEVESPEVASSVCEGGVVIEVGIVDELELDGCSGVSCFEQEE